MKQFFYSSGKSVIKAFLAVSLVFIFAIVMNAQAYKRQSNNKNSVRVDVLPVQLEIGKEMTFDIKMNSHSVTLNSDIVAGSVVSDDSGAEYKAVNWDGTPPGDHHRSGKLIFPALNGNPKSITLVIKGVSKVPERIYKWDITIIRIPELRHSALQDLLIRQ